MRIIVCDKIRVSLQEAVLPISVCLYQDVFGIWHILTVHVEYGRITSYQAESIYDNSEREGIRRAFLSLGDNSVEAVLLKLGRMPLKTILEIVEPYMGKDFEIESPTSPPIFPMELT